MPEAVHALAATTFVQSVDSPTLATVVPLLSRALGERGAGAVALKRQTALIICNMSKLVDDARDAAPFLPKLLPGLVKLADEMSDPEARDVCERSVALMQRLEAKIAAMASADAVKDAVEAALADKSRAPRRDFFFRPRLTSCAPRGGGIAAPPRGRDDADDRTDEDRRPLINERRSSPDDPRSPRGRGAAAAGARRRG